MQIFEEIQPFAGTHEFDNVEGNNINAASSAALNPYT